MAREPKYGVTFNGWERLDKKLEQYMADFPHLEAPRVRLREMISLGLELMARQALHMAGKQEATQRLQALLAEGRKLATFLRTGVRQQYGNRSEKLAEFDLQPFRGRKATPPPEKRPGKQPDPEQVEQSQGRERAPVRSRLPLKHGSLKTDVPGRSLLGGGRPPAHL